MVDCTTIVITSNSNFSFKETIHILDRHGIHSKKDKFNTKLVSKDRNFEVPYRSAELKRV